MQASPQAGRPGAATKPWTGGQLDFDSPEANIIFDPATGDGLYLIAASQSFSGMSGDELEGIGPPVDLPRRRRS